MNKTKIEWADRTWNPVSGCRHDCPYCYAEKIAKRFGKRRDGALHVLNEMELVTSTREISGAMEPLEVYAEYRVCPYPFGFDPTFHRYKLERPQKVKEPQNVFVCSMADLFGEWVPDEWIEQVFDACCGATQHRYLFLTKNPERYYNVIDHIEGDKSTLKKGDELSALFGASVTNEKQLYKATFESPATWLSIEPILEDISGAFEECCVDVHPYDGSEFPHWLWIVLGAESGNRKNKVIPERKWIEGIVEDCRSMGTPVFMKNSLAPIWGEPLIQEYPWEKG